MLLLSSKRYYLGNCHILFLVLSTLIASIVLVASPADGTPNDVFMTQLFYPVITVCVLVEIYTRLFIVIYCRYYLYDG